MNDNWFAIYTKPRNEKRVFERLIDRGFNCYLPLKKVLRKWSDRKKIVDEPLISSYVFVKTSEKERCEVLKDPGVLNFVFWLGKPACIKEEEIIQMKKFLGDFSDFSIETIKFNAGDKVRLLTGPMSDNCATVLTQQGEFVYLSFSNLGFQIKARAVKCCISA